MRRALLVAALFACYAQAALACVQMYAGGTIVHGDLLRVKLTYEGKPLAHVALTIHRAETYALQDVIQKGVLYGKKLETAVTDEHGNATFKKVGSGKYWIVMHHPSGEEAAIDFQQTRDFGQQERVNMAFFADYCHKYTAERM